MLRDIKRCQKICFSFRVFLSRFVSFFFLFLISLQISVWLSLLSLSVLHPRFFRLGTSYHPPSIARARSTPPPLYGPTLGWLLCRLPTQLSQMPLTGRRWKCPSLVDPACRTAWPLHVPGPSIRPVPSLQQPRSHYSGWSMSVVRGAACGIAWLP